ncbi:hypothetical protein B0A48_13599 [Cryoendolithus antarcticus]|uniref:Methyltransferase domain-containing protein n=1 Tax=Cryoendolithus antarcticus TaxID=1507870 RepID=A0A1V8SPD1_9PEZI|nr:hypothetical protein B0A48_13599 [Cryoendolithus antarcticus]
MAANNPSSEESKQFIEEGYDKSAEKYLEWSRSRPVSMQHRLELVEKLYTHLGVSGNAGDDPSRELKVLELGCGAGEPVTLALASKPAIGTVTANDISKTQLDMLSESLSKLDDSSAGKKVKLAHGDMTQLEFPLKSLDAVIAFYSIIHLSPDEQVEMIGHIHRWLRSGSGYLLASFGADESAGTTYDDWLGMKSYWSSHGIEKSLKLVEDADFEVLWKDVNQNPDDAPFLWDDALEQSLFAPQPGQTPYDLEYHQLDLWPTGVDLPKPWASVPEDLRRRTNGILTLKMRMTAEDVALFPNLKVIVRMGVGYDRLDRVALAKHNVIVCNVPDYGTSEIADHAMGLVLSLRRGILLHHERQRATPPASWNYINSPLVARLQNKTFGVFGLGRIGTAAALRAKAFGFNVLFYDPYLPNGVDKSLALERTKDVRDLFRRSEVLSLHAPCTRETRGMVGYDLLSLLPRGAVLVNTARGEIVDLDGVQRCLQEGILAGAGLDVLPEEPIPEDDVHPLIRAYRSKEPWLEGRMVITCHTAFYSPESFVDIRVKSAETMRSVLIDGIASNVILPEME